VKKCSQSLSDHGRNFTRSEEKGPVQELAISYIILLSSATRSSLVTIHLLLPVFFLQSASRPGKLQKSDGWLSAGILSRSGVGHWPSIPSPRPSPWDRHDRDRGRERPEQELTLSPRSMSGTGACQQCSGMCTVLDGLGPEQELTRPSQSSCDLLQPGLLCLRSIFFYQSSFFSRRHDQGLTIPPHDDREPHTLSVEIQCLGYRGGGLELSLHASCLG